MSCLGGCEGRAICALFVVAASRVYDCNGCVAWSTGAWRTASATYNVQYLILVIQPLSADWTVPGAVAFDAVADEDTRQHPAPLSWSLVPLGYHGWFLFACPLGRPARPKALFRRVRPSLGSRSSSVAL